MGFLDEGTPLSWNTSLAFLERVRKAGIEQLRDLYLYHRDRQDAFSSLNWGEEIEFMLVNVNDDLQTAEVAPIANDILPILCNKEKNYIDDEKSDWRPEYGSFMIEALPSPPYHLDLNSIKKIFGSMITRRNKIQRLLPENVYVTTLTSFPTLGVDTMKAIKNHEESNQISDSIFFPDRFINSHSRYGTLTSNIYRRRGAKVEILVPLFIDRHTLDSPEWNDSQPIECMNRFTTQILSEGTPNPIKEHIYMDAMGFGMGMSCIQMTYGCPNIDSARVLYDQLLVLAPLWLSMSAATPFFRGLVADTDTRWHALESSVDCRTQDELSYIKCSRYSSAALYIGKNALLDENLDIYNDVPVWYHEEAYQTFISSGMDPILAKHVASLFIRDPLVIFAETTTNIKNTTFHFENFQSTNWNSVRFKPPPAFTEANSLDPCKIGWRVEFRTAEAQLTDFENAAFCGVLTALVLMMRDEPLNLYIPMRLNHINIDIAAKRNSAVDETFWFRDCIEPMSSEASWSKKSLCEIFFGKGLTAGILTRCQLYCQKQCEMGKMSQNAFDTLCTYIQFFYYRSKGHAPTNAMFFRNKLYSHQDYNFDSRVSSKFCYDLVKLAIDSEQNEYVSTLRQSTSISNSYNLAYNGTNCRNNLLLTSQNRDFLCKEDLV